MAILNKDFKNVPIKKPVKCDLIKEIMNKRDELLVKSNDLQNEYRANYKKDFENVEKHGYLFNSYSIGSCLSFLFNHEIESNCEMDVVIYTSEWYLLENNKYRSIYTLPNGANILILNVFAEENPVNIYTAIYFDGIIIRSFTPYCGNSVNILFKTALGDEGYTKIDVADLDKELNAKMFPDGHKLITDFEYESDYDEYVSEKVLAYYKINDFNEAENSENELFDEIINALS